VVVFDRATLATVATIPAGANPDAIVFEPATQTVWAFSVCDGRKMAATDARTGKTLANAVGGDIVDYRGHPRIVVKSAELIRVAATEPPSEFDAAQAKPSCETKPGSKRSRAWQGPRDRWMVLYG
jgi:hypothetical protein